ncbi:MAG TPA: hypothetical protein VGP63_27185, partial [Planctomycetaceae bacterium]|nr:hypothetical protein [Planctomycetaceae bacterium]
SSAARFITRANSSIPSDRVRNPIFRSTCSRRAFGLALARDPSARETRQCIEFLDRQRRECQKCGASDDHAMKTALAQLCRTLYNTSEFLYSE